MTPEQFQTLLSVLGDLQIGQARTEQAVVDIKERLDKLNGSVGRHEREISEVRSDFKAHAATEQGAKSVISAMSPAVWVFIGALTVLLLMNGEKLIAAMK